jgi:hypothetical protein
MELTLQSAPPGSGQGEEERRSIRPFGLLDSHKRSLHIVPALISEEAWADFWLRPTIQKHKLDAPKVLD